MSNSQLRIRNPKGCRPITNPAPGATAGPPRRVENLPSSALGHYPSDPVDAPVAVSAFPIPHSSFPTPHLSLPPTPDPRPLTPAAQRRPAFTLVELMITIAILAILASLVLVAVGAATESAKKQKTETMIATLNGLLMDRYDSYKTRRVPVDVNGLTPKQAAAKRLAGIRWLMLVEMPERWSEVGSPVVPVDYQTALFASYARRKSQLSLDAPLTTDNEGAECLYMIITMATGEGEALSYFSDRDIGDTDGDGAKEFLDGWGNPITFVRWPFGFASVSELMTLNADTDHDPFDPFRLDTKQRNTNSPIPGLRLLPLVVSAGPDENFDLIFTNEGANFSYLSGTGLVTIEGVTMPDPYADVRPAQNSDYYQMGDEKDSDNLGRGEDGDNEENWHDNIHNHLMQRR